MDLLELGSSGIKSCPFAIGTEHFGSTINESGAFELLDAYVDCGGTLIDTTEARSHSADKGNVDEDELILGKWLRTRGNREQVLLSSTLSQDSLRGVGGSTKLAIAEQCEKALQRLQTDRLDVYYSDVADSDASEGRTLAALDELVRDGKVRILGAGNLPVWRIAEQNVIARSRGYATYQLIQQFFTFLRPRLGVDFGDEVFLSEPTKDFAEAHNIGLLASSPLLGGMFSSKGNRLPAEFAGADSEDRLTALHHISREVSFSPDQVVLAWMRQSSPSVLPVLQVKAPADINEAVKASDLLLTPIQMGQLSKAGNPGMTKAWL